MRTVEVTFEKSEFLVVSRSRQTVSAWCARCEKTTRMMPPEKIISPAPRKIYQWIEGETVSFAELPDGLLLVCAECVRRRIEKEKLR